MGIKYLAKRVVLVVVFVFLASTKIGVANAQNLPRPIDLRIQNISQQTPVWCWAAVAQQIVMSLQGVQGTPAQCSMVAIANNKPPQYCCSDFRRCSVTGSLQQIQGLIAHFGGRYSSINPPADPMTIYNTLLAGRPIIMAVKTTPYAGHVVVIRGMKWINTRYGPRAILLINDPLAFFSAEVDFQSIGPYWQAAIVVN
ncbi:papain-like cysteine protease family protein [Arenicella xantha]|uniref:Papain like cysteine protease AvrRpt2 n=1 Tax=Arenicella xantha TaxID=644221 RepID=A0A395JST1_9GAMM|nr:papain-like cysteine protease family protein [Arenicella xantha]RBP53526.1 papain like cysteine protease AvrRpt2 [Arenicella xantha]